MHLYPKRHKLLLLCKSHSQGTGLTPTWEGRQGGGGSGERVDEARTNLAAGGGDEPAGARAVRADHPVVADAGRAPARARVGQDGPHVQPIGVFPVAPCEEPRQERGMGRRGGRQGGPATRLADGVEADKVDGGRRRRGAGRAGDRPTGARRRP